MGAPLGGGGHTFVFGDVSVVQGAAGQGGLLLCGAHLALCRGTAAGLGAALSLSVVPGESHSCLHPFPLPPTLA